MKKIGIAVLCAFMFMAASASAENTISIDKISVIKRAALPSSQASSDNFIGTVTVDRIFSATDPSGLSAGYVNFGPGARTNWHTHPKGQMLIITAGRGWVQQWDGPKLTVEEGDTVWFPADVKHWHGATADTPMSHISVAPVFEDKSSVWLEKVTDEQYAK